MESKPTSVMILGKEIKITYHRRLAKGALLGDFCEDKELIRVTDDKHLLHECLHAIIRLSGQREWMSEEQEEGLVRALENGLQGLKMLYPES